MCNHCDYNSPDNQIYVDLLTNEHYLGIETSECDGYDDGWNSLSKKILGEADWNSEIFNGR